MTLEIKNLCKSFGGVHAVDNVSFGVRMGEVVALIGPNGAGKSTCFQMLQGLLRPDSGEIAWQDKSHTLMPALKLFGMGIGRSFQITQIFPSMTVLENVVLATRGDTQKALNILQKTGLAAMADSHSAKLSYGDRKRLDLALALSNVPQLLLMDEPTAGMAVDERQDLMRLVRDLAKTSRVAVLFTEHDMDIVFEIADRIVVMAQGKIVASGGADEIQKNPLVKELYLGNGDV